MKIKHNLSDRGHDFYASPPEAIYGLLSVEKEYIPSKVWEPACGDGGMVYPLRKAGFEVSATDLIYRECENSFHDMDFLAQTKNFNDTDAIITNPPYKIATEFVEHSLKLAPYSAFLLRLTFLESARRTKLFVDNPLACVYVFSSRLPMMHRHGWEGPKTTSTTAYAWFVWDKKRTEKNKISWITKENISDVEKSLQKSSNGC